MKLSIIVPVYNCEDKIGRMLDSILSYDEEFEIICVNDGSTDNTLQVLKKYKDKRINIYTKENGGTFKAWQYGLQYAIGEYVCIMDQDDYVDKEGFSIVFDFINNIKADVLFTPYYLEQENGNNKIVAIPFNEGLYRGKKLERIRAKLCSGLVPYAKFSKVIRKKVLEEQVKNTYQGYIQDFEDWLTMIQVLSTIDSLYIKNKAYYHYIQYNNSNSGSKSTKSYRKNYKSLHNMISFLDDNSYSVLDNECIDSIYFYASRILIYKCIKIKEFSLANKILKDKRFLNFIPKANLGSYERIMLRLNNARLIYLLYITKKKISGLINHA